MDRIFKDETGITPRAYLLEVKLQHVTELLKESDYKVKELCRIAGFFDEFQFMKIFKAKFGMTVKEYRRNTAGYL